MNTAQERKEPSAGRGIGARIRRIPVLTLILVLLIIQVLFSAYQVYDTVNDNIRRTALTANVMQYTQKVDQLTSQMLTDYKNDVYNSPKVDTTAKQAVMSGEYNFNVLMLVVKQNNRLLELVAQIK